MMNVNNKIKCAFLIPDDAWLTTVITPAEIYSAIDFFWKPKYNAEYSSFDISYLSVSDKKTANFSGLSVETKPIDEKQYDMITIAAMWRPDDLEIRKNEPVLKWLRQQHKNGAIIIGMNTGQFYMAAAGLLDGVISTVHRAFAKSFRLFYPNVKLNENLTSSESNNLICTTGVRSNHDVMMMIVEKFCGKEAVQLCSKYYEFDETDWFEGRNLASHRIDPLVEATIEKIRILYNKDISLKYISELLNVSARNLSRRFQKQTGITTMRYVQKYRMQVARQLLADSKLSVEQIAHQIGFSSATVFGRSFKAETNKSPLKYRNFILSRD